MFGVPQPPSTGSPSGPGGVGSIAACWPVPVGGLSSDDRETFSNADQSGPEGAEIQVVEMGESLPEANRLFDTLTDRQQTVLRAAVECGYYRTPRDATIDDVAEAVNCAPDTAGEHLRKIEARVFQRLIG